MHNNMNVLNLSYICTLNNCTLITVHFKKVKIVKFMLCLFSHTKNEKRIGKKSEKRSNSIQR